MQHLYTFCCDTNDESHQDGQQIRGQGKMRLVKKSKLNYFPLAYIDLHPAEPQDLKG